MGAQCSKYAESAEEAILKKANAPETKNAILGAAQSQVKGNKNLGAMGGIIDGALEGAKEHPEEEGEDEQEEMDDGAAKEKKGAKKAKAKK